MMGAPQRRIESGDPLAIALGIIVRAPRIQSALAPFDLPIIGELLRQRRNLSWRYPEIVRSFAVPNPGALSYERK